MCGEKVSDSKSNGDLMVSNNNENEFNNDYNDIYAKKYNQVDDQFLTKLLAKRGITFKSRIKWDKVFLISLSHLVVLYAAVTLDPWNHLRTVAWGFLVGGLAGFGVTGGAHRLWAHKAYKANMALRIIYLMCFSSSGQNTLYEWIRDHRVHHKFSETDADPHNAGRGFFFAHVGWLMLHKHPEVIRKGRMLDMSDVLADPVVMFHEKYFIPMKIIFCFLLPVIVPVYCWNETWSWSILGIGFFKYIVTLNVTWSVNSAAHLWGTRPYDMRINPAENKFVAIASLGEGWHNYHHVFPWDYKAAELGNYTYNFTTFFIDTFAKIGWVRDRREPSKELVRKTFMNHGDGTHPRVIEEVDDSNDEICH